MIKRVYVDTSVVGGQFDKESFSDTQPFLDTVIRGEIVLIVSDLLEAELSRAPQSVRAFLENIPKSQIEKIKLSLEAVELADRYIAANVFGKTSRADCQHIAMATVVKADVLVS